MYVYIFFRNRFFVCLQLTDDEVTRIYRERNPLERLAQLNSLKQRESSVVRDMIMSRVGAGSRTSASSTRPAFGVRRPRNSILTSTVPLPPKDDYICGAMTPAPPVLNSLELERNFQVKSQSCHQLEQLMDFPLIDADESEMSPTPPVRPARRNAKSPKRSETAAAAVEPKSEKSEILSKDAPVVKLTNGHDTCNGNKENEDETSPKQTPVKKTVSLPATPLTDPEKFGIPVRNTSKHCHSKNQAARKKLALGINNTSRSSDENNSSLASPGDQISSTSNEIDNMDGIVSSDGSSMPNSPAKRSTGGSMSQTREPKKTFIQAITGMFGRGTTPDSRSKSPDPKSSESERKSRSDSFIKFAKGFRSPNNVSQKSSPSSPEAPRADISELSMSSHTSYPNSPRRANENVLLQNEQNLIFQTISIQASHPSTPPFPLSRKITLKQAHSEESLSDEVDDGEGSPETSLAFVANNMKTTRSDGNLAKSSLPPEILEKILRRGGKSAKRASKIAQLKRVRKAQEIQRQLEELDVRHKDLEERGVKAEQSLRGETSNEAENMNEGELMQTWFLLLAEKNALVRSEQELLVQAKQLELEDMSARLEVELREHLLRDSRSPDSVSREGEILDELLEISEQREMLQSMLVRDKMRYQLEDKDIEAQMRAKGIRITPIRKISAN